MKIKTVIFSAGFLFCFSWQLHAGLLDYFRTKKPSSHSSPVGEGLSATAVCNRACDTYKSVRSTYIEKKRLCDSMDELRAAKAALIKVVHYSGIDPSQAPNEECREFVGSLRQNLAQQLNEADAELSRANEECYVNGLHVMPSLEADLFEAGDGVCTACNAERDNTHVDCGGNRIICPQGSENIHYTPLWTPVSQ